jgi:hypothetical protein
MRLAPVLYRLALASVVFLMLAPAPAGADSPLRINEFVAGPARDWDGNGTFSSRDDEWVEVMNTDPTALDLAGFLLTDGDSIPRYAFSGSLSAGDHLVVFGRNAYDWERVTGHPAYGLSLGNSGDAVLLWRVVGPDTLLVDGYTYRSHEAAADRAVGRVPDGGAIWALFDGLNPYTGSTPPKGTGCFPTPAAVNVCDETPTRRATWGEVRAIYR